jgi:hypothetical protein
MLKWKGPLATILAQKCYNKLVKGSISKSISVSYIDSIFPKSKNLSNFVVLLSKSSIY